MYKHIMVPVDLTHVDQLEKALKTAADLSKTHNIPVTYVGATTSMPGEAAHSPEEFEQKLKAFAQEQAQKHGLNQADAKALRSHDPARDLDKVLIQGAHDIGADVIVMASHVPGVVDHVFESHGGSVALHADLSVFVIR
jgi:nucleotide-binding universal stress UspA family protein